jgi:hypothetical protein
MPLPPPPPGEAPQAAADRPSSRPPFGEGQKCRKCGTLNPERAEFCWRCYNVFSQPEHSSTAPAGPASPSFAPVPSAPLSTPLSAPYSQPIGSPLRPIDETPETTATITLSRGIWGKVAIVAIVLLVVVGGSKLIWDKVSGVHLEAPATIGTMERIDDPAMQAQVQSLEQLASVSGTSGKAGYYGSGGIPSFFFAAIEYPNANRESPEDIFQQFSSGFASASSQLSLGQSRVTDVSGETTFICTRIRGSVKGSLCMWVDRQVVGFVGAYGQSINTAHDLTAVVRSSVEA